MTRTAAVAVIAAACTAMASLALPTGPAPASAAVGEVVELRPLGTRDGRIVDDLGRDVILRGANVNSLGEYWQGVPGVPANLPVGAADWDSMASHGFSVVRLIVSWSRIEPSRDVIDESYLDLVEEHVDAAAARGIYTVIDMHQDAYTAFLSTTDPASCPAGTSPAKGWDGAPAWATLTDGLSTCLAGSDRNSSPAVRRAWNNFYDDVDGIRTEFAQAWAAVAERFAGRPEVAGYDLINEPEVSAPAAELGPKYEALLHDTATAIRAAESGAAFEHILFVEPALPAGDPTFGLVIPDPDRVGVGTDNVVSAPHNYAESIIPGITIEQMSAFMISTATGLGLPTWIGEYGFWDTEEATLAKVRRYAADEDRHAIGGAWWQWRQSCGDPHAVAWREGSVVLLDAPQVHLNLLDCPDNSNPRPNDEFLDVLGRGYPRATPGRITSLTSDPDTGEMLVVAEASAADVGREIVVWTPTVDDVAHRVVAEGLDDVQQHEVVGGRIVTATVRGPGEYSLSIGVDPDEPPTTTEATSATSSSTTTAPSVTETSSATTSTVPTPPPVTDRVDGSVIGAVPAAREAEAMRTSPRYTG